MHNIIKAFTLAIVFVSFLKNEAPAQNANVNFFETEKYIADIDSQTIKLRSKLYPVTEIGDLNIYGFDEDVIPEYSDSAYKYRLSLLETEIPLDYNQHVKAYIDLYAVRKRKLVSKVLTTSKFYFPIFEEILDREKMPIELKYLAVIESALNQNAVSHAGAVGLWQFIAPTGRHYGLKTNNYIDERREIIKSTEAAVQYLKNSYRIYNDWLLVIASYNCGPGNVNKAIRLSGGKTNFWEIMPYLPKETRGYVPAFVAATYIMNYAAEHNIYPDNEIEIYPFLDTLQVDNTLSLEKLALAINVPKEEILHYNPALRRGILPFSTDKITLTLPYHYAVKASALHGNTELNTNTNNKIQLALAKNEKTTENKIVYSVKSGDILTKIAKKYNVSLAELKQWNKGKIKGNSIQKGQKLNIYPRA
ncbi:MAG: transglycosylase SLT domain-containing protein [Bacteroidia bacterium]